MNINTKYGIGDRVWLVRREWARRIVRCGVCKSSGAITYAGEEFVCPKCEGKAKHTQCAGMKAYVAGSGVIGRVQFEYDRDGLKISYMADSWGVGSGSILSEDDLFPSEEDAIARCVALNSGTKFEDDTDA